MEKILIYSHIFFFVVTSVSFAIIAYAQFEISKSQKVQAVAYVMQQDNVIKGVCNVAAYTLLTKGFSVEEIYTYLYKADKLPQLAQN